MPSVSCPPIGIASALDDEDADEPLFCPLSALLKLLLLLLSSELLLSLL